MANKIDPDRARHLILLLKWEGQLGNSRLRELFDLKSVRASEWLREFRTLYPRWTKLNSVSKTYEATFRFRNETSKSYQSSLSQYLALAGLSAGTGNETNNPIVSAFPEISTPNPEIFSVLTQAAKLNKVVEVTYSSMGEPKPHTRIISPHSIVQTGSRWHVRAYSDLNKEFRDYTLGRISAVKKLDQPSKFTMSDDKDWMTEVEVRIIAHPDLSFEQENVIRLEYFASTSARIVKCRAPLINYFIKQVGAAVDVEKQRPPEYFLAVGNLKEISQWLYLK